MRRERERAKQKTKETENAGIVVIKSPNFADLNKNCNDNEIYKL